MTNNNKENMIKWVKTWKLAAVALAQVKRNELRAYNYKKNQTMVDEMIRYACQHGKVRLNSGLVEQQRLFVKFKEKELGKKI